MEKVNTNGRDDDEWREPRTKRRTNEVNANSKSNAAINIYFASNRKFISLLGMVFWARQCYLARILPSTLRRFLIRMQILIRERSTLDGLKRICWFLSFSLALPVPLRALAPFDGNEIRLHLPLSIFSRNFVWSAARCRLQMMLDHTIIKWITTF